MLKFLLTVDGYEVRINDAIFGYLGKDSGFFTGGTFPRYFMRIKPEYLRTIAAAAELVMQGKAVHPDGPR